MFSSLATASHAFAGAHFFPFFIIAPIFWLIVVVLIIVFVIGGRRRRMARWGGYGQTAPWGPSSRSAESTLAERFAQGDIDEKEFRARLEVLRANSGSQQSRN